MFSNFVRLFCSLEMVFFKPEEPCDVVDLVYDTSDRNVQYSIEWADIVLFCNFDKRGR